jgi:hypothetical protein
MSLAEFIENDEVVKNCLIVPKTRLCLFKKWAKRPDVETKWRQGFLGKNHLFQGSICPANMDKNRAGIIIHQPYSIASYLCDSTVHQRIIDPNFVDHPRPNCIGLIALTDTDGQSEYRVTEPTFGVSRCIQCNRRNRCSV